MLGQTISHYQITGKLGAGGMGEVFLAKDTKLDRHVALKFLPLAMWDDANARHRLIIEAKAASKLDHPNIVTIHGIEEFKGRPFIVMAYVVGRALDDHLAANKCSTDELIELFLQITDALQYAHESGVVHRDLKPGNILVDERGRVRILDFGLARLRGTSRLTRAGSIVGTLAYTPPELLEGSDAEPASDIYSLGVVLYQMLAGRLPFDKTDDASVIYSILQEEPQPLSDCKPAIPANLEAVVMRCLEKLPERRYPNCVALSTDLRSCQSRTASGVRVNPPQDKLSIAVLPFANMSRDPDNEYFSDGLTEELLNLLTTVRGLRVAARTSSFHFKGKTPMISEVGRALNVASVLEGSVRKAGNRVRITVQLIKVSDGFHLWSETYDRTLEDIFTTQDEIARSVVTKLRATLLGAEADWTASVWDEIASAAKGRGENLVAHELYLKGRYFVDRLTREDVAKALGYFQQAVALDPKFALAWSGLSRAYADMAGHGWMASAEGFRQARAAALRALELEPDLAEGHVSLGLIRMSHDWDWVSATESVDRALALAPGKVTVLRTASHLASNLGQLGQAIDLVRRAVTLDPLSATAYHSLAIYCYSAGRLEEAEEALGKALELNPSQVGLQSDLARVHLAQGRAADALLDAMREPLEPFRLLTLAAVQHAMGAFAESDATMRDMIEKYSTDGAYQIAEACAARGEVDQAFEWLERAFEQRDPGLPELQAEPMLRALHGDARWLALLKKMGFKD